jgi:hypothetical protein
MVTCCRVSRVAHPLKHPEFLSWMPSLLPHTRRQLAMSQQPATQDALAQQSPYRKAIPITEEMRQHCHIYLDEQLCTRPTSINQSLVLTEIRYQCSDPFIWPRYLRRVSSRTSSKGGFCAYPLSHRTDQHTPGPPPPYEPSSPE